ncbi:hypothetical protein NHX12_026879 [Muraenolepis orangiensis]|uniref:RUN domain-containing protein n=1 Tax=Muraenolepis orangiensis TaxID=630683 RepID=A0A9Q0ILC4_9TELE|nr:hypothetical protein NHX12_026879 [Muraenolepis orangiensis]
MQTLKVKITVVLLLLSLVQVWAAPVPTGLTDVLMRTKRSLLWRWNTLKPVGASCRSHGECGTNYCSRPARMIRTSSLSGDTLLSFHFHGTQLPLRTLRPPGQSGPSPAGQLTRAVSLPEEDVLRQHLPAPPAARRQPVSGSYCKLDEEEDEEEDINGDNLHRYHEDSSFVLHGNNNWAPSDRESSVQRPASRPGPLDSLPTQQPTSDSSCTSSDGILVNFYTIYNKSSDPSPPRDVRSQDLGGQDLRGSPDQAPPRDLGGQDLRGSPDQATPRDLGGQDLRGSPDQAPPRDLGGQDLRGSPDQATPRVIGGQDLRGQNLKGSPDPAPPRDLGGQDLRGSPDQATPRVIRGQDLQCQNLRGSPDPAPPRDLRGQDSWGQNLRGSPTPQDLTPAMQQPAHFHDGSVFLKLQPLHPRSPSDHLRHEDPSPREEAEAEAQFPAPRWSPGTIDSNCNLYSVEPWSSLELSDLSACIHRQLALTVGTNQKYYKLEADSISCPQPSEKVQRSEEKGVCSWTPPAVRYSRAQRPTSLPVRPFVLLSQPTAQTRTSGSLLDRFTGPRGAGQYQLGSPGEDEGRRHSPGGGYAALPPVGNTHHPRPHRPHPRTDPRGTTAFCPAVWDPGTSGFTPHSFSSQGRSLSLAGPGRVCVGEKHQNQDGHRESQVLSSEGPLAEFCLSPYESSYESLSISHLQRRGLLRSVSAAVDLIIDHFGGSRDPGEKVRLGSSGRTPTIGGLVLQRLCPAIRNILEDGLRHHRLDVVMDGQPNHTWRLVEASTRNGGAACLLQRLVTKIQLSSKITGRAAKLQAFIMGLLNLRALEFWLSHLQRQNDVLTAYYHSWAFMTTTRCGPLFQELLLLLQPLAVMPFDLNLLLDPPHGHMASDTARSTLLMTGRPKLQAETPGGTGRRTRNSYQTDLRLRGRYAKICPRSGPDLDWWVPADGTVDGSADSTVDGVVREEDSARSQRYHEAGSEEIMTGPPRRSSAEGQAAEGPSPGGLRWANLFGATVGPPGGSPCTSNRRPSQWLRLDSSALAQLAQSVWPVRW